MARRYMETGMRRAYASRRAGASAWRLLPVAWPVAKASFIDSANETVWVGGIEGAEHVRSHDHRNANQQRVQKDHRNISQRADADSDGIGLRKAHNARCALIAAPLHGDPVIDSPRQKRAEQHDATKVAIGQQMRQSPDFDSNKHRLAQPSADSAR
jgi:hypothetical protein